MIVKALAKARSIEEMYGKPDTLFDDAGKVTVEYRTEEQLQELKVLKMLKPEKEK